MQTFSTGASIRAALACSLQSANIAVYIYIAIIALRTAPKNRTSHGRPPARLRQTLTFVLKIREEKRPKTE